VAYCTHIAAESTVIDDATHFTHRIFNTLKVFLFFLHSNLMKKSVLIDGV